MSEMIFLLFSVIFIPALSCQEIKTVEVEFSYERSQKQSSKNAIRGILYYLDRDKTFIKVNEPVNQMMILQGNELLIYYPDDSLAFRIKSQVPNYLPFFQAFISVMKEDYGLTESGYSFIRYEKNGNRLVAYWKPADHLAKLLGEASIEYVDNKLTAFESKDPKGNIVSKTVCLRHLQYGGVYFPLEISIVNNSKAGSYSERVEYINPLFNSPIPQEIRDFKIPAGTKIKEVEW